MGATGRAGHRHDLGRAWAQAWAPLAKSWVRSKAGGERVALAQAHGRVAMAANGAEQRGRRRLASGTGWSVRERKII